MSKRRWFQFHLSTAVVLMFVAGGLLWANTQTRCVELWRGVSGDPVDGGDWVYENGWPLVFWDREVSVFKSETKGASTYDTKSFYQWSSQALVADVGICLAILIVTGILLEWRIRRKAAKP